jgi:two-component system OmpR family response regulator
MQISKPRKIFIVEDDPMQADLLKDRLTRDTPHEVKVFYTGESCMRSIAENPEVIVIDYHLNSNDRTAANGLDILSSIKKYLPDTYIIMLSSQERYGVALQSIQKGAENYVVKDQDAFEKIISLIDSIA